tara:strand:+ start:1533 stop:1775 length:243 start_codon:yes stop_codon:yes gene_type:complete
MTKKYSMIKINESRNEFEALLRIYGISNLKLCKIMGINPATSRKYIEEPTLIRFIHAYRLSQFMGLKVQDIVDTIVYDLN